MSDLVKRLRADADGWALAQNTQTGPFIAALERDAADEIELLQTALRRIKSLDEKNVPKYAQQIATEALKK